MPPTLLGGRTRAAPTERPPGRARPVPPRTPDRRRGGTIAIAGWELTLAGILALAGFTALLIRLPYRPPLVNGIYTAAYLLSAYAYLRHRLDLAIPPLILLCPVLSVAVDVLGNALGLYGTRVGAVEFDDLTHVVAGALALPPVMWLTGEVARRQSVPLPRPFLALLATCVTFSLSAYYEIVELWDELFLGGARLWDAHDSPSDLQWNLLGIVVAAILAVTMRGRRPNNDLLGPPTP